MVIKRSGGRVPTTFLDAGSIAALRHVVDLCATRPAGTDTVFDIMGDLQELIGCDRVSFNGHDTPGRRLYHAQVVGSGERQITSPERLAAEDDEPFWRWYWHCEPCSAPDRIEAPVVVTISDFYTTREWVQHPMFVEALGLEGPLDDEMVVSFPDVPGRTHRLLFDRASGARFDERERFLMNLLMPHIRPLLAGTVILPTGKQVALTDRQREVLRLVRLGMANKQIAQALKVSTGTVRKHLENIYDRLGVQSRTAAVRAAALDEHPPRISPAA